MCILRRSFLTRHFCPEFAGSGVLISGLEEDFQVSQGDEFLFGTLDGPSVQI